MRENEALSWFENEKLAKYNKFATYIVLQKKEEK